MRSSCYSILLLISWSSGCFAQRFLLASFIVSIFTSYSRIDSFIWIFLALSRSAISFSSRSSSSPDCMITLFFLLLFKPFEYGPPIPVPPPPLGGYYWEEDEFHEHSLLLNDLAMKPLRISMSLCWHKSIILSQQNVEKVLLPSLSVCLHCCFLAHSDSVMITTALRHAHCFLTPSLLGRATRVASTNDAKCAAHQVSRTCSYSTCVGSSKTSSAAESPRESSHQASSKDRGSL